MKKVVLLLLMLSLLLVSASSCVIYNEKFQEIWYMDNKNWRADEINLRFSWEKGSGWVNGTFNYNGKEYPVAVCGDIDCNSVQVFVYYDELNFKESFDAIYFISDKVLDENTFTLKVEGTYRKVFDLPKKITFHRIIED